jgi:hypothetical protein
MCEHGDVPHRWSVVCIALAACGRVHFEPVGRGPTTCGPQYQPVANLTSTYRVGRGGSNWFEAELDCESDGGHLVVIDSQSENDFVLSQMIGGAVTPTDLWIGLSDHVDEGTMVWVTGEPLSFENFEPDEPNDANGEDCIQLVANGQWNDAGCKAASDYVCECDRAPVAEPPTYCDTETLENCGECGTTCTSVCSNQTCGGGGGG